MRDQLFRVIISNMTNAANDTTIETYTTERGNTVEVTGEGQYRIGEMTLTFSAGRSIRLTDRTNAGKRGATCPTLSVYSLYDELVTADRRDDMIDAAAEGGFAKAVEVMTFVASCMPGLNVETYEEKGAHTAPARFDGFSYADDKIAVRVDFDSFAVADLTDPMNEPRTIPRGTPDARKCAKLAGLLRAHRGALTMAVAREAIAKSGVKSHSYCAMD